MSVGCYLTKPFELLTRRSYCFDGPLSNTTFSVAEADLTLLKKPRRHTETVLSKRPGLNRLFATQQLAHLASMT